MKIYALTTLQRYAIEIQVRLFNNVKQCQKEYDLLIKDFENNKDYIINKGIKNTEIEYNESPEILVSIQTYELNDVINNQVYCVIRGNQDCYEIGNENLYLFNDKTKANEKFLDLYILYNEYGYDVKTEKNTKYFSFDNNNDDWGHCKTELIKIESKVKK